MRESHHSLQSTAEVKNAWSHTSTLPYVVIMCCLTKHRETIPLASFIIRLLSFNWKRNRLCSLIGLCKEEEEEEEHYRTAAQRHFLRFRVLINSVLPERQSKKYRIKI
jgi:hypothetical protein